MDFTLQAIFRGCSFPLVTVYSFAVFNSFNPAGGQFLAFVVMLALVVWLIIVLCLMAVRALRRNWRGSARALLMIVGIWPFFVTAKVFGDYVHLAVMYPFYVSKLHPAVLPSSG